MNYKNYNTDFLEKEIEKKERAKKALNRIRRSVGFDLVHKGSGGPGIPMLLVIGNKGTKYGFSLTDGIGDIDPKMSPNRNTISEMSWDESTGTAVVMINSGGRDGTINQFIIDFPDLGENMKTVFTYSETSKIYEGTSSDVAAALKAAFESGNSTTRWTYRILS